MKINIISDLHGYFAKSKNGVYYKTGFDPAKLEPADVLVVAGDLGYRYTDFADIYENLTKHSDKYKKMIVVHGNHDFYDSPVNYVEDEKHNFVEYFPDENVWFICTPLWTPITYSKLAIKANLNDYYYIPDFTVELSTKLYYQNIKWIESMIDEINAKPNPEGSPEKRIVIVTHHMPHEYLIEPRYIGNRLNEAFCVMKEGFDGTMEAIMKKPNVKVWAYGHCHTEEPEQTKIPGCDILFCRNPIGYCFENSYNECNFSYNFTVEV